MKLHTITVETTTSGQEWSRKENRDE